MAWKVLLGWARSGYHAACSPGGTEGASEAHGCMRAPKTSLEKGQFCPPSSLPNMDGPNARLKSPKLGLRAGGLVINTCPGYQKWGKQGFKTLSFPLPCCLQLPEGFEFWTTSGCGSRSAPGRGHVHLSHSLPLERAPSTFSHVTESRSTLTCIQSPWTLIPKQFWSATSGDSNPTRSPRGISHKSNPSSNSWNKTPSNVWFRQPVGQAGPFGLIQQCSSYMLIFLLYRYENSPAIEILNLLFEISGKLGALRYSTDCFLSAYMHPLEVHQWIHAPRFFSHVFFPRK